MRLCVSGWMSVCVCVVFLSSARACYWPGVRLNDAFVYVWLEYVRVSGELEEGWGHAVCWNYSCWAWFQFVIFTHTHSHQRLQKPSITSAAAVCQNDQSSFSVEAGQANWMTQSESPIRANKNPIRINTPLHPANGLTVNYETLTLSRTVRHTALISPRVHFPLNSIFMHSVYFVHLGQWIAKRAAVNMLIMK